MKIELAQKNEMETMPVQKRDKNEPYYPCVYISNVDSEQAISKLSVGDEVVLRGVVKSVTQGERKDDDKVKKSLSLDVECRSLEASGASEKPKAFSKKQDEEEVDKGIDEAMDKEEDNY